MGSRCGEEGDVWVGSGVHLLKDYRETNGRFQRIFRLMEMVLEIVSLGKLRRYGSLINQISISIIFKMKSRRLQGMISVPNIEIKRFNFGFGLGVLWEVWIILVR